MKKFLLATVLAFGVLGVEQSQVRADGCCLSLGGCWRIKICAACKFNCSTEPFSCCPQGGGGGGYGGGCAYDNCGGPVPGAGPWYAYWPSAGGAMYAGGGYPGWTYSDYFSAPAPTGYPYWPAPMMAPGPHGPAGGLQPVGHYPSYWYGH